LHSYTALSDPCVVGGDAALCQVTLLALFAAVACRWKQRKLREPVSWTAMLLLLLLRLPMATVTTMTMMLTHVMQSVYRPATLPPAQSVMSRLSL